MSTTTDSKTKAKRKRTLPAEELDEDIKNAILFRPGRGLFICRYCQTDVSDTAHVVCAICKRYTLCMDCFAVGAEKEGHEKTHDYYVRGDLSYPLYEKGWWAAEELLLLEAMLECGPSSWQAVSKYVGSKTPEECRDHYFRVYVKNASFPLPQEQPNLHEAEEAKEPAGGEAPSSSLKDTKHSHDKSGSNVEITSPTSDTNAGDSSAIDVAVDDKKPNCNSSGEVDDEAVNAAVKSQTKLPDQSRAGSVSTSIKARENIGPPKVAQAPKKLGKLDPKEKPLPAEQPTVNISKRGLVVNRTSVNASDAENSTEAGKMTVTQTTPSANPADAAVKAPPPVYDAAGYHSRRQEFEHEYDNDAERLIADLTFLPTDSAEQRRSKLKLVEIYNKRLAERFSTEEEHEKMIKDFTHEEMLRERIRELKFYRSAGVRTFQEMEAFDLETNRRNAAATSSIDRAPTNKIPFDEMLAQVSSDSVHRPPRQRGSRVNLTGPYQDSNSLAANYLANARGKMGMGIELDVLPGAALLNPEEQALCQSERMLPGVLLRHKMFLVREAQKRKGCLSRVEAKTLFNYNPGSTMRIYDMLLRQGILRDVSPDTTPAFPDPLLGHRPVTSSKSAEVMPEASTSAKASAIFISPTTATDPDALPPTSISEAKQKLGPETGHKVENQSNMLDKSPSEPSQPSAPTPH